MTNENDVRIEIIRALTALATCERTDNICEAACLLCRYGEEVLLPPNTATDFQVSVRPIDGPEPPEDDEHLYQPAPGHFQAEDETQEVCSYRACHMACAKLPGCVHRGVPLSDTPALDKTLVPNEPAGASAVEDDKPSPSVADTQSSSLPFRRAYEIACIHLGSSDLSQKIVIALQDAGYLEPGTNRRFLKHWNRTALRVTIRAKILIDLDTTTSRTLDDILSDLIDENLLSIPPHYVFSGDLKNPLAGDRPKTTAPSAPRPAEVRPPL